MKKIYKIVPDPSAPELVLENGVAEKLAGESVARLSPDKPFVGHVERLSDWTQFYRVGTNAFAVSEEAWNCEDMYYNIAENNVELLAVKAGSAYFIVIYPMQFLPPSEDPSQICDLTYVNALFRIQSRPPQEVFCFEGMANPDNEFKHTYEKFGFTGLIFEEVWRGD